MTDPSNEFEADLDGFPTEADPRRVRAREQLEVLASEFAEKSRQGQRPSIDEYVARYPQLEDRIRELFPMVAALEQWKTDRESELLRQQLPDQFQLKQLGECRIIREIGRGGMGVVFEALEGRMERRVAVKLLPWRISLVSHRQERFENEARTIARLRHANIVPIYSFGRHEDYAYYVMQYVDSVSLARILDRLRESEVVSFADEIREATRVEPGDAPRPPEMTSTFMGNRGLHRDSWKAMARIGVQVAQALRHAHRLGVLHNDVKPGNLLVDREGRVWVTDFGLAEDIDAERQTDDSRVTGTLRYMAPERFQGIRAETSDIYSLGVTLYELVTREVAFQTTERTQMLEKIEAGSLRPARDVSPDVPADLDAILRTATSLDPAERYATAGEFASDLLRFINGEPVLARRSRRGMFWWLKRKKKN